MDLKSFRVTNYRNVIDSGWIDITEITAFVGQNEAGKSNLFEALYRISPFQKDARYTFEEDWPVDRWGQQDKTAAVCQANFILHRDEVDDLFAAASIKKPEGVGASIEESIPESLNILCTNTYANKPHFSLPATSPDPRLDETKVDAWAKEKAPKFVYIHDYEMSGAQIELDVLQRRKLEVGWNGLTHEEQTILTVLDLARIDIEDFIKKGGSPQGRTTRSFDKRAASAFLTSQFQDLWRQKKVKFDIDIDATTLNIFAEDEALGMPVRLNRRSTGFRWHVAFAWKFTHASRGQYSNCVLLLEEPGIHLHYSAQRDLLEVFERLKNANNTILYTTHLASMVDLAYPERVRIVETTGVHSHVKKGVVSNQRGPMAVIEMRLGLTGDMAGLLGNRKTLIVEGGDDALILTKLSGVLRASSKTALSDEIYLWPADGASKTPMYAAFAIGQKWNSGVLLDSDKAGKDAKKKIEELYLKELSKEDSKRFRVLLIGDAAGIKKTDAAIEDLFPDEYYLDLINKAFSIAMTTGDLPKDGSDMITKRVEVALMDKFHFSTFDKTRVVGELLNRFDKWSKIDDLPPGTAERAEKLFSAINRAFTREFQP